MAGRALETERAVYLKHIDEWRHTHAGKFVLIKGSDVIGFYDTIGQAFDQGTERYGLEDFLVHQVTPEDTVNISFYGESLLSA